MTVVIYTSVGGFRAVVLTDTIQGIMMAPASAAILFAVVHAGGGLEAVFLWPTVLGLYRKMANATGALISMLVVCGCFFLFSIQKISFFGMHAIVPTIALAFIAFVAGSFFGKGPDRGTLQTLWE